MFGGRKKYENVDVSVNLTKQCHSILNEGLKIECCYFSLRDIPENYKILFMQGGCTGMFAAVAMNFLKGI